MERIAWTIPNMKWDEIISVFDNTYQGDFEVLKGIG
jgi:hypothetical protein